jgi:predicted DNA-binding protein
MKERETVRINFEFPKEEYPYLKMLCAKRGLSLKKFATQLLIRAIEEYEDEQLAKKANERLKAMSEDDTISWDEARRLAGWEDDEKL